MRFFILQRVKEHEFQASNEFTIPDGGIHRCQETRIGQGIIMGRRKSPAAFYLETFVRLSGIPIEDLARTLGYDGVYVLSKMIAGETKIPIDQIRPIALAIGLKVDGFADIVMNEYVGQGWRASMVDLLELPDPSIARDEYVLEVRRAGDSSVVATGKFGVRDMRVFGVK